MMVLLLCRATALVAPGPPLLDSPVYSLATLDEAGATNMNILTYASPVGIRPVRLWAVSLYRPTKTHANFAKRKRGVLQLLAPEHAKATWVLGGASGKDVDKAQECAAIQLNWEATAWADEALLPRCAAYVSLEEVARFEAGDHDVCMCKVVDSKAVPTVSHLTMRSLRTAGLVTPQGRAVEPPSFEILHDEPRVVLYRSLLTGEECTQLISYAGEKEMTISSPPAAQLDPAKLALLGPIVLAAPLPSALHVYRLTADLNAALAHAAEILVLTLAAVAALTAGALALASSTASPLRTSSAVALNDDAAALPVAAKIAALLNTTLDFVEAPVVSRYQPGQQFATHNDASAYPNADWGEQGGQRIATCILYLNDVPAGGATAFDKLDVKVQPRAGAALVFFPADPATGRLDDRTTHCSEPAIDEKWIVQVRHRR